MIYRQNPAGARFLCLIWPECFGKKTHTPHWTPMIFEDYVNARSISVCGNRLFTGRAWLESLFMLRIYALWIVLIVSQAICLAQDSAGEASKRTWSRSHIGEYLPDGKDTRLEFGFISQESEHLLCSFVLARQREQKQLIILGQQTKAGTFTPNVSLEVSDQEDGNWKRIVSSFSEKDNVMLKGEPHVELLSTQVEMDAFQPYIGKFKFGRVVLQTGESDVFPMAWLTEDGGDSGP